MAKEMNFGPKWIRRMYEEKDPEEPGASVKPQLANYRYGYEEMLMLIPTELKTFDFLVGQDIHVPHGREPAFQQPNQPTLSGDFPKRSYASGRKNFDRNLSEPFPTEVSGAVNGDTKAPPFKRFDTNRKEEFRGYTASNSNSQLPSMVRSNTETSIRDLSQKVSLNKQAHEKQTEPIKIRDVSSIERQFEAEQIPPDVEPTQPPLVTCEELEKLMSETPPEKPRPPDVSAGTYSNSFIGYQPAFSGTSILNENSTFTLNLSKEKMSNINQNVNALMLSDIESPDHEFTASIPIIPIVSPPSTSLSSLDSHSQASNSNILNQPKLQPESVPTVDPEVWLYVDPKNRIQGPFTSAAMARWYSNKFFPDTLPIKRIYDEEFRPLSTFVETYGELPFYPGFNTSEAKVEINGFKNSSDSSFRLVTDAENTTFTKLKQTEKSSHESHSICKQESSSLRSKPVAHPEGDSFEDDFLKFENKRHAKKASGVKQDKKAIDSSSFQGPAKSMFAFANKNENKPNSNSLDQIVKPMKTMSLDHNSTHQKKPTDQNSRHSTRLEITIAADLESNWLANSVRTDKLTPYSLAQTEKTVPNLAQIQSEEQSEQQMLQMRQAEASESMRESKPVTHSSGHPWNIVHESFKPIDFAALIQQSEPTKKAAPPPPKIFSETLLSNPPPNISSEIVEIKLSSQKPAVVDLAMGVNKDVSQPSSARTENKEVESSKKLQNQKKAKKEKQQQKSIKKLFAPSQVSAEDEFQEWCLNQLFCIDTPGANEIDIATFVEMLKEFDSPYDIHDTVKQFLGETKECQAFAKEFVQRKSKLKPEKDNGAGAAALSPDWLVPVAPPTAKQSSANTGADIRTPKTSQTNVQVNQAHNSQKREKIAEPISSGRNEASDVNRSAKKGKTKKGQKINPAALLHISTQPAADRVKIGEIEKA